MQCQTCGLNLDPQQVAQTGRCPRCGTPVQSGAFGPPAGGSGTYGQVPPGGTSDYPQAPTFGQSPTIGGPPPYGPPSGTYNTMSPSQPDFGAPSPQQGYGAPPPGFGGPPPQGFPGGPIAPPKKGKTGLIVLIAVIVVVLLAGGVVGALALTKKPGNTSSNNTPGASATSKPNQPTATPTKPATPAGFQTYSNSLFSVSYPNDWMKSQASGQGDGIVFTSATGQVFEVGTAGGQLPPTTFDETYCSTIGMKTAGPTTVTIGGEQWTQETCTDSGGTLKSVVESVDHNNNLFLIAYASLVVTFDSDQTQYFMPMEQSFQFLS